MVDDLLSAMAAELSSMAYDNQLSGIWAAAVDRDELYSLIPAPSYTPDHEPAHGEETGPQSNQSAGTEAGGGGSDPACNPGEFEEINGDTPGSGVVSC